jgi:hypothetical protein
VVNIITGKGGELIPHLAKHMDVNAVVDYCSDAAQYKVLQSDGAENVKRMVNRSDMSGKAWFDDATAQSPYWIEECTELKTAWHPIGV